MALGDANNYNRNNSNNNGNKVFDPRFYSRLRIKNKDKLSINFEFGKGLLKVIISEEKDGFRTEPITEINLSPTKARLLSNELEGFITRMKNGEFIDPNAGVGVNTGLKETVTFIAFKVTGNRSDVPEHGFVIGKVSQTGDIADMTSFIFNVDYDFSLNWSNVETMDVQKNVDQFMGITLFKSVLDEFVMSASGAIGASVWDTGRYEMARLSRKIDPIFEKLGIEKVNSRREGPADNFFTKQGAAMNPPQSAHSNSRTMDEIENLMMDDYDED